MTDGPAAASADGGLVAGASAGGGPAGAIYPGDRGEAEMQALAAGWQEFLARAGLAPPP